MNYEAMILCLKMKSEPWFPFHINFLLISIPPSLQLLENGYLLSKDKEEFHKTKGRKKWKSNTV